MKRTSRVAGHRSGIPLTIALAVGVAGLGALGPGAAVASSPAAANRIAGQAAVLPAAPTNAPGAPGTPSAPTKLFTENFENPPGAGDALVALTAYPGAGGVTYTADNAWLSNCDGNVVDASTPTGAASNCDTTGHLAIVVAAAGTLGTLLGGPADPTTNHAVTAYTTGSLPIPGQPVVLKTVNPITFTNPGNRFLTMSVDVVALNCGGTFKEPQLTFNLVDATNTLVPLSAGPDDPCHGGTAVTVDGIAGNLGTFYGNKAVLSSVTSTGLEFEDSETNQNNGNDFAFDNVRLLDATPQLDVSFAPTTVTTGQVSTLTYTITNTSDLADKTGWSFANTLPVGLTVAGPASTNCGAPIITTPGNTSVSVAGGDLAAGASSCTVTVPVTAANPGSYTDLASDVTVTGLDLPATTTLNVLTPTTFTETTTTPTVTAGTSAGLGESGLPGGATGTVTFKTGATVLCTLALPGPPTTCLTPTTLAPGIYPITATYSGDGADTGSSATNTFNLTVLAPTTFTESASATTITAGGTANLSQTGLPTGAGGTVTFKSGNTTLCVLNLPAAGCTTATTLPPGTYPITATYSGDATHAGSTATNCVVLTVRPTPPARTIHTPPTGTHTPAPPVAPNCSPNIGNHGNGNAPDAFGNNGNTNTGSCNNGNDNRSNNNSGNGNGNNRR